MKTIYPSHYGEYNATDVLLGRQKWSEVPANGEVVSDLEDVESEEDAAAALGSTRTKGGHYKFK